MAKACGWASYFSWLEQKSIAGKDKKWNSSWWLHVSRLCTSFFDFYNLSSILEPRARQLQASWNSFESAPSQRAAAAAANPREKNRGKSGLRAKVHAFFPRNWLVKNVFLHCLIHLRNSQSQKRGKVPNSRTIPKAWTTPRVACWSWQRLPCLEGKDSFESREPLQTILNISPFSTLTERHYLGKLYILCLSVSPIRAEPGICCHSLMLMPSFANSLSKCYVSSTISWTGWGTDWFKGRLRSVLITGAEPASRWSKARHGTTQSNAI